MITILGAGLAGLSCSFHLGHEKCIIFEGNTYAGGHSYSHHRAGFVWDEGPHVSFTKHAYVRDLFEESVQGDLLEYSTLVGNYFQDVWIPHPAQSNLFAVPEPYRTACLDDFLKTRGAVGEEKVLLNYADWLQQAFGDTFTRIFSAPYTRKYWTCEPSNLTTDWVGERIFYPDIEIVKQGFLEPPRTTTHYISTVRYPSRGGYISFGNRLLQGASINFGHIVDRIDLEKKLVHFTNGKEHHYTKLINTLPLPVFIRCATNAPPNVRQAAECLSCTSLLLVNVTANHSARQPYHWLYVYDEDKLSTRVNQLELLCPNNVPVGKTGLQVEVYSSRYRPFHCSHAEIAGTVVGELQEMGLIHAAESVHTQFIPYANIIFDHSRREAQETILNWLERYGLQRESDDLEPMTNWKQHAGVGLGVVTLAGRFGQWKYFWSDDCVLRGQSIANYDQK